MINIVNEAINRKLASISFTNIVVGKVESVNPLEIRINNRIVIGQSFIEPMSLGLNDYSPNSALPLIVGETIQMIRYNNGQRFYVLGKTAAPEVIDYTQLNNLPLLVTAVAEPLEPAVEPIKDKVILHKVSKSGCYKDLYTKPKLNTNNNESLDINNAEEINDIINLHKISKTGDYNDLKNLPSIQSIFLNTNNNESLVINDKEELKDTINLHKISKTGNYNDLKNLPSFNNYMTLDNEQTITGKKTYNILPVSSLVPTLGEEFVNKNYVDDNTLQYDILEEFTL